MRIIKRDETRSNGIREERYYCPGCMRVLAVGFIGAKSLETGITLRENCKEHVEESIVIDMVLRNNSVKRIVIPKGKVTSVGELQYVDNVPVGYDTTISAAPYETWDGDTHREYILGATGATGATGET